MWIFNFITETQSQCPCENCVTYQIEGKPNSVTDKKRDEFLCVCKEVSFSVSQWLSFSLANIFPLLVKGFLEETANHCGVKARKENGLQGYPEV